jgi:predicted Zn-ribbon and HTH transcriptional regulator
MKRKRFICKDCGFKFEEDIVEQDEARERNLCTSPVKCKHCGSQNVEER